MENKFFLDTENEFYECEDSAEFAKNKSQKKDSESNENRQPPSLAKEFYKDSAKHLQEELALIGGAYPACT